MSKHSFSKKIQNSNYIGNQKICDGAFCPENFGAELIVAFINQLVSGLIK